MGTKSQNTYILDDKSFHYRAKIYSGKPFHDQMPLGEALRG